jgi:hypothetical protein
MSTLTVEIPDTLRRKLEKHAGATGVEPAKWLRGLIQTTLQQPRKPASGRKKPANLLEALADGIGVCDSGMPDLASNKKHLAGYGK